MRGGLQAVDTGQQRSCGVSWKPKMPKEVRVERTQERGKGVCIMEGTKHHGEPSRSFHQGDDMVTLHFRKITMATLWGMGGQSGRRRNYLGGGKPGQKDGMMPRDT